MTGVAESDRPPRVFLDSNVIFSGLHSPEGPPGRILQHMVNRRIKPVVSRQILDEVVATFSKKLPQALPALKELLLNIQLEVVGDPGPGEIDRWSGELDTGDASILTAAIAANPDFFATGDSHFLDNPALQKKSGLTICSPSQLLETLDPGRTGHIPSNGV